MQELVQEYQRSEATLYRRICQLNKELKTNEELGNQDRDMLMLRRNLLMAERYELMHDIEEMQSHGRRMRD